MISTNMTDIFMLICKINVSLKSSINDLLAILAS